jgi:undecaprenyl-diphosphatase
MDARLYLAVNRFVVDHDWIGRSFGSLETWAVPVFALATVGLWLLDRPGAPRKWKLAAASAVASAALALLVARVIGSVWARQRPFSTHPSAHVWGSRSHDPSFPSDHASAAFAIAVAVLCFDLAVGSLFVAAAAVIALGRVIVGAHYPADVLGGLLVGVGSAVLVVRLGQPVLLVLVRLVERITDPVVALLRRPSAGAR